LPHIGGNEESIMQELEKNHRNIRIVDSIRYSSVLAITGKKPSAERRAKA